jgi:thiol-disulfide isomerase/thioredoxin
MKYHNPLLLLLFVFVMKTSQTQSLQPGESFPYTTLYKVYGAPGDSLDLQSFRGKLILLDFWASFCAPCIHQFNKLDSLQKKYGDKIQVLLVNTKGNGDTYEEVGTVYDNWKEKFGRTLSLFTVVEDKFLKTLFPHDLIPHYAWIGSDGIVQAITGTDEVNEEMIKRLLAEPGFRLLSKVDIDVLKPLYSGDHFPNDDMVQYSVLIKGKQPGMPSGSMLRYKGSTVIGRSITNEPLLDIYISVLRQLYPETYFNKKRIIVSVNDSSKLWKLDPAISDGEWDKENRYSIDLIVPENRKEKLYEDLLDMLNKYSGFTGRVEKRKVTCYTLIFTGDTSVIASKGGKLANRLSLNKGKGYLRNIQITALVNWLNDLNFLPFPVIDNTGYRGMIDLSIRDAVSDLKALQNTLGKYNLSLKEEVRELSMFPLIENR